MSIPVTGGTKGIGLEIACRFATPGVDVFLNYVADDEAANRAARRGFQGQVIFINGGHYLHA